jgi:hypothetical protein
MQFGFAILIAHDEHGVVVGITLKSLPGVSGGELWHIAQVLRLDTQLLGGALNASARNCA